MDKWFTDRDSSQGSAACNKERFRFGIHHISFIECIITNHQSLERREMRQLKCVARPEMILIDADLLQMGKTTQREGETIHRMVILRLINHNGFDRLGKPYSFASVAHYSSRENSSKSAGV